MGQTIIHFATDGKRIFCFVNPPERNAARKKAQEPWHRDGAARQWADVSQRSKGLKPNKNPTVSSGFCTSLDCVGFSNG